VEHPQEYPLSTYLGHPPVTIIPDFLEKTTLKTKKREISGKSARYTAPCPKMYVFPASFVPYFVKKNPKSAFRPGNAHAKGVVMQRKWDGDLKMRGFLV
jgi:hypothetical protein